MKKLTYTTAILMAMTASGAFAHHPAADVVDPEVYERIEENVADSPHIDRVMDEMGSSMEQAAGDPTGAGDLNAAAGLDNDTVMEPQANVDVTVDTMDLIDNVEALLAQ